MIDLQVVQSIAKSVSQERMPKLLKLSVLSSVATHKHYKTNFIWL
jgi:hypothetical protein